MALLAGELIKLAGPSLLNLGKELFFGEEKEEILEPKVTSAQIDKLLKILEPEEKKEEKEFGTILDRILGRGIAVI